MQIIPERLGDHYPAGLVDDESRGHFGTNLWVEPLVNAILTQERALAYPK